MKLALTLTDLISILSPPQLERPTKQMREAEERLKAIPQFCFPDAKDWLPVSEYNRYISDAPLPHSADAVHLEQPQAC